MSRQTADAQRVTALHLDPESPAPDHVAKYFAVCEEKLGFVPNVLKAYAFSTAKLDAFSLMYNELMLGPSGLSKLEREMIALVVSAENRCFYCLTAHGAAVRGLSGDPAFGETLAMNWRAAELSPRHHAMLSFAVKATRASAEIEDADRSALREHGFADADIWDIAAVVGFFNMSNRMASAVGMKPNDVYHAQAR